MSGEHCPRCLAFRALDVAEEMEACLDAIAVGPLAFCAKHAPDACSQCGCSLGTCIGARVVGKVACCPDCEHFS